MKKIEKKVLPEYYKEIRSHRKMFELRKDDSDYEVGDILILREWDGEKYTGCRTSFEITYILRNCPEYGLMDGYCILSLQTPWWDSIIRSQEPAGTPYNGKCPECGERIHTRWRFCPFCGKAQIYIPPWKV